MTPNSSTLIDVILASNVGLVKESGVIETHISDHYLIYSILKLKTLKPPPNYIIARSYRNCDPEFFVSDLSTILWLENLEFDDVNEKYEHFSRHFFGILDKHAPLITIKSDIVSARLLIPKSKI